MKTCQSGMPDQTIWEGFFAPERVLSRLGLARTSRDVVDFGCGYGTFTVPAGRIVRGTVHALDIEAEMINATTKRAKAGDLDNVLMPRATCGAMKNFLAMP